MNQFANILQIEVRVASHSNLQGKMFLKCPNKNDKYRMILETTPNVDYRRIRNLKGISVKMVLKAVALKDN